jgi:hypothetical protein
MHSTKAATCLVQVLLARSLLERRCKLLWRRAVSTLPYQPVKPVADSTQGQYVGHGCGNGPTLTTTKLNHGQKTNNIHLGTCENAAENGGFGGCFQQPFHQSLTRAPGRFNPFLGFSRQAFQGLEPPAGLPTFSPSFLLPPPHFFRGPYFKLAFQNGFLYDLRVLARSIYGPCSQPVPHSCLPHHPPLIILPRRPPSSSSLSKLSFKS